MLVWGYWGLGSGFLGWFGVFVDVSLIVDRRFEWSAGLVACGLMSERVGSLFIGWLGLGAFGCWGFGWFDEPESLILAQSERWRHA